jgi:agmatine deiminase
MGEPMSRRELLKRGATLATGVAIAPLLAACTGGSEPEGTTPTDELTAPTESDPPHTYFAPAEDVPHERTWMAWPARRDVWGGWLGDIRHDIVTLAKAIVAFEPVSLVVRPDQARAAAEACGPKVDIVEMVNDDLWIRDMGPVFLIDGKGGLSGLDLNFNGWGDDQVHVNDATIAQRVLELVDVPRIQAPFVAEGGALEVDGDGTVMATASSIVNKSRNPGKTKEQLDAEILAALGARKMLWVPGVKGHDITDDHIDALARFVRPGLIVIDQPADPSFANVWARSAKEALSILSHAVDGQGRAVKHRISRESSDIPPGADPNLFVNVYVNWYVCNGAVILPAFTDKRADAAAHLLVAELYPDREPVQLRIDTLGKGGGGIHCATRQQPAA